VTTEQDDPAFAGYALGDLASRLGGLIHGDRDCLIRGVAVIQQASPGTVTFLANPRYRKYLAGTSASAVILSSDELDACPVSAWVVDNPYLTFAKVAALLHAAGDFREGVHETAFVSPDSRLDETAWIGPYSVVDSGAEIGARVQIGPGCYVGEDCFIGEASRLVAHVVLCGGTRIGKRALVHPGVVIGSDGFGMANDGGTWIKIPQLGRVWIGDDVEIGANTTIDRGTIEDTVIEDGVKLDNQIQVGHNVRIGAQTAIAGCVGIAGSTTIGKRCAIGGGAGIGGHLEIGDGVQITGMCMVTKSIREPGIYSSGMPAQPNRIWRRGIGYFRRIEELVRRVQTLEEKLARHD
jgi:UDP-3-O-[3-hydroxymyristoyl] glucosamine N-acyltransferase